MNVLDFISALFLTAGLFFFTVGTIGLFRLPDLHTRLHALTKADNVGLGFTVLGLMISAPDWITVMKLALVWVLVLVSGATVCCLIADHVKPAGQATEELGRNDP